MNSYEEKQAARKARYEERAEKAAAESEAQFKRSRDLTGGIPMGQPILVGHHSEQRHRRTLERSHNAMGKGVEASQKAVHYAAKAASVGKGGISSDDPQAGDKLDDRIKAAESAHQHMKDVNAAWRKAGKPVAYRDNIDADAWQAAGVKYPDLGALLRVALDTMRTDFLSRAPFTYQLSNNSANIKRMKSRVVQVAVDQSAEHKETEHAGFTVVENVEENRIQIVFPGKPSASIRQTLKGAGFRWSRYNEAWQRHLNNAGRYAVERVVKELTEDKACAWS